MYVTSHYHLRRFDCFRNGVQVEAREPYRNNLKMVDPSVSSRTFSGHSRQVHFPLSSYVPFPFRSNPPLILHSHHALPFPPPPTSRNPGLFLAHFTPNKH